VGLRCVVSSAPFTTILLDFNRRLRSTPSTVIDPPGSSDPAQASSSRRSYGYSVCTRVNSPYKRDVGLRRLRKCDGADCYTDTKLGYPFGGQSSASSSYDHAFTSSALRTRECLTSIYFLAGNPRSTVESAACTSFHADIRPMIRTTDA